MFAAYVKHISKQMVGYELQWDDLESLPHDPHANYV